MKNSHKAKGYRLDNKIKKSAYLEFRKLLFPSKFETINENRKNLEIQRLQVSVEQENQWLSTYIVKPEPQLEKYLIQSHIKDLSYISSLNKIDSYLNNEKNQNGSKVRREEEKIKKHHSQSTEVQSANKIA